MEIGSQDVRATRSACRGSRVGLGVVRHSICRKERTFAHNRDAGTVPSDQAIAEQPRRHVVTARHAYPMQTALSVPRVKTAPVGVPPTATDGAVRESPAWNQPIANRVSHVLRGLALVTASLGKTFVFQFRAPNTEPIVPIVVQPNLSAEFVRPAPIRTAAHHPPVWTSNYQSRRTRSPAGFRAFLQSQTRERRPIRSRSLCHLVEWT